MATFSPIGFQFFDANGTSPLSGGKVYTYSAGTTDAKATYTSAAGTTSAANPIVLNSAGRAVFFLGEGAYKFIVKDALDNTIQTIDGINGSESFGNVDTIADLKALKSGQSNSVYVGGRAANGDGGGGWFYWDSTSSATDDGALTVTPNSSPSTGRWLRVIDGNYSLKWFSSLANAITAISTTSCTLEIPEDVTLAGNTTFLATTDILITNGAKISNSGHNLTINKCSNPPDSQWIVYSGSGDIKFGPTISEINAAWFGITDCNYAGASEVDSSAAITAACRSAYLSQYNYSAPTVTVPEGLYFVGNTAIQLHQYHGFVGKGTTYSTWFRKMTGATGPILEFTQTTITDGHYTFGARYGNFSLWGTGTAVDATNDGLVMNAWNGFDQISIKNIRVYDCGGWGLKIVEGGGIDDTNFVTMQHSVIENIKISASANGCYTKGFVTDNTWIKCTFDPTVYTGSVYAFHMDYQSTLRFAFDNTFVGCSFQHANIGFYCNYIAWNAAFKGCHFEYNTVAHVKIAGANTKTLSFNACTFQRSPIGVHVASGAGVSNKISLYDCRWWVWEDSAAGNRFIKDETGNEIYVGPGQYVHYSTGMAKHVEIPSGGKKLSGYVNPYSFNFSRNPATKGDLYDEYFLDPDSATPTITPDIDYASTTEKLVLTSVTGTFQAYETITGGTSGKTARIAYVAASGTYWIIDRTGDFSAAETITGSSSGATGTYSTLSSTSLTNLSGGYSGQEIWVHARGAGISRTGNLKTVSQSIGRGGSIRFRRNTLGEWNELTRKEVSIYQFFTISSDAVTIDWNLCKMAKTTRSGAAGITVTLSGGQSSNLMSLWLGIGGTPPASITWVNGNGGSITWDASHGGEFTTPAANTEYLITFFRSGDDFYEVSRSFLDSVSLKSLSFSTVPTEYADDAAAAAGGLAVGDVYRTGSALKVRVA